MLHNETLDVIPLSDYENACHVLMQKAMNFNDVAIVSIKGNDYRIHFCYMSKDDAINIMNNSSSDFYYI